MAVFVVIPMGNESKEPLAELVSQKFKDNSCYTLKDNSAFFVKFDGTSSDFATALDLNGHNQKAFTSNGKIKPCFAVVTPLGTYSGFASSDLWEWLRKGIQLWPPKALSATLKPISDLDNIQITTKDGGSIKPKSPSQL